MGDLFIVIIFSLIGGVFSLIGGLLLILRQQRAQSLLKYVTPFAAGALLSAAFTDILADAVHEGYIEVALQWTLVGIIVFFLLERFLRWFHHHHSHRSDISDANAPLIIVGDTVHNFIDGIAIAAAFLVDVPTGIITTVAVAAHEIPQELGDFGLLLDKGMSKADVIKANVLSALATTAAATIFFMFGKEISMPLGALLGLVAGFFIYIAVSDIIPSIHKSQPQKLATIQAAVLIAGILFVSWTTGILHTFIDAETDAQSTEAFRYDEHHNHAGSAGGSGATR